MKLDFSTVTMVQILTNFFVAVCLVAYGVLQKTAPGFRLWVTSFVLAALGWLPLLLRSYMPFVLSTVLVNAIFAFVALTSLDGVRRFLGRGPLKWIYYLTPAPLCLVVVFYTVVQNSMAMRNLAASVFMAAVAVRIAHLFWKHSSPPNRAVYLLAGPVLRGFFSIHLLWRAIILLVDMPADYLKAPAEVNFHIILSIFFHYASASVWFMLNNQWSEGQLRNANVKLEQTVNLLQEQISKVRTLSGLLPICSNCKKIRDDKGYWQAIEGYISKHSEAEFSHGLCPPCAEKLYPDLMKDIKRKKEQ